ncbi:MAG TPA: LytR C-terminal domain-containing protein, partial [Streptosporangiaceae bacterium]|nr:LytR C-terminal domain-containing protein [Streptosporangiaceae bacterium]
KGFDALSMAKVGQGLQGMTAGKVRFVTVPWGAYAPDINRVALRQPAADDFFTAIRNDKTAPNEPAPATTAAAKAHAKIPASQVKVRVFNASGIPGQALRVKDLLTAQGFVVVKVGNGTASMGTTTRVLYASGADQQAATLAALVPGGKTAAGGGGAAGVVDLVLGTDWTGLKGATKKATPIPTLQGEVKATDNICKVQAP